MNQFPSLRLLHALLRRGAPVYATKDGIRFRIATVRALGASCRHQVRGMLFVRRLDDQRWVEPDNIELP